jgi:hypothetical protein
MICAFPSESARRDGNTFSAVLGLNHSARASLPEAIESDAPDFQLP